MTSPSSQADIDSAMQKAGDRLFKAFQSYHSHNKSYSFTDEQTQPSSQLSNKIASHPSPNSNSKSLLYDPLTVTQTENYKILHSRPQLLSAQVPATLNGHNSLEILAALTDHATKMSKVEDEFKLNQNFKDLNGKEFSASHQFNGHESEELTKAFVEYAKTHDGLPKDFLKSLDSQQSPSKNPLQGDNSFKLASNSGVGSVAKQSATIGGTLVSSSVFSFASLASSLGWAKIIYGIFWIALGLFLLFFGWASFNWTTRPRSQTGKKITKSNPSGTSRAILGGGVGGAVVGFLFMSMLSTLILCAICSSGEKPPPSPSAYFAIWLLTGLVGAALGGHIKLVGKVMTGLGAGTSSTLILTAMFGIHTLLIRIVLMAVLCTVFTSPLLIPRTTMVQKHLLNAFTSLFGVLVLLDGVSLFAPPKASSDSWLNLWVILFSPDESASENSIIEAWGTSSFKGYIAGAVLGAVVGFLFEFFFHKHSGENAEEEWNEYLGTYTEKFSNGGLSKDAGMPGTYDGSRAGLFEPSPNVFARIGDYFAGKGSSPRPASYGNLSGGQSISPLTERSSSKRSRATSSRSKKTTRSVTKRGTPARFQALGTRDNDLEACEEEDSDQDSDATECDSDTEIKGKANEDKEKTSFIQNYGGYALPVVSSTGLKPPGLLESPAPSYRTSGNGNDNETSSTLSGSTKFSGNGETKSQVHKPLDVYRDKDVPSSPPSSNDKTNGQNIVAATPSLINAITRIQQAQAQARSWQAQQQSSPYETDPKAKDGKPDSS